VVSVERTNLSEVHADQFVPAIGFAATDLSCLSLRKAVPIMAELFTRHAPEMVCLSHASVPTTPLSRRHAIRWRGGK
jgi:predicted rRNA methylase YqxC with S4 and FtsJ domains